MSHVTWEFYTSQEGLGGFPTSVYETEIINLEVLNSNRKIDISSPPKKPISKDMQWDWKTERSNTSGTGNLQPRVKLWWLKHRHVHTCLFLITLLIPLTNLLYVHLPVQPAFQLDEPYFMTEIWEEWWIHRQAVRPSSETWTGWRVGRRGT